jgi:multiple sugar transport system permease protein
VSAVTMRRVLDGPWLTHLILIALGSTMLYPFLWLIASSLKPNTEIFSTTSLIPSEIVWENYAKGWNAMPRLSFSVFIGNSLFISAMSVIGSIFCATLVGFGFARVNFRFRSVLFALMLATLMMPYQAVLVPQYIVFKNLGWVNTYLPLTVPPFFGSGVGGVFFIFLMVQFMRGVPRELDEAAQLDGCSTFGIYWRIIMPLCAAPVATVAIFAFLWSWDDFIHPVIYLADPNKFVVAQGLRLFMDNTAAVSWGGLFAMSVISVVPNLVIFLLAQKHFVGGIATSGLKG